MNRILHVIVFGIVVGTFIATGAFAQETPVPKGWKRVTACEFSFLLPEKTREISGRPIDSCIAAFEYRGINIGLDYGLYSSPVSEYDWMENYQNKPITINGREARLITYDDTRNKRHVSTATNLRMITTKAPYPGSNEVSLLMVISGKPSIDRQIVKRIYESVKFLGK
jgi:hypothetical protein